MSQDAVKRNGEKGEQQQQPQQHERHVSITGGTGSLSSDGTGRRPAKASSTDEERESRDPIPQFLHWVEKKPVGKGQQQQQQQSHPTTHLMSNGPNQQQQQQQQQYDYGALASTFLGSYDMPYSAYNQYSDSEANSPMMTGGYGSVPPPPYSHQQYHGYPPGLSQQPQQQQMPPMYPYYAAPHPQYAAEHQQQQQQQGQDLQEHHAFYGGAYPPMVWSSGTATSGARPPIVPTAAGQQAPGTTRRGSAATAPPRHRRVRSSSARSAGRKGPDYGGAYDQNDDDYDESVPFLGGRQPDGTEATEYYTATKQPSAPKSASDFHRRVWSDGYVTTSLVRFKDEPESGYGSVSPTALSTGGSASSSQQPPHPLLRNKPPSGRTRAASLIERNSSFDDELRGPQERRRSHPGHRRVSSESGLPPVAPVPRHHRRSSSRSALEQLMLLRSRARTDSAASSVVSDTLSVGSVVTDITKSALFGGITESGIVQFHLPVDNVHLVVTSKLIAGTVYKERVGDEDERYTEYHALTADSKNNWHDLMDDNLEGGCTCNCDNCMLCTSKSELLPPNRFALVVEEDVYRRVIKEISDSKDMPCGLFFCGHHEDVDQPSIFIAIGIVGLFFLGLLVIACWPET